MMTIHDQGRPKRSREKCPQNGFLVANRKFACKGHLQWWICSEMRNSAEVLFPIGINIALAADNLMKNWSLLPDLQVRCEMKTEQKTFLYFSHFLPRPPPTHILFNVPNICYWKRVLRNWWHFRYYPSINTRENSSICLTTKNLSPQFQTRKWFSNIF